MNLQDESEQIQVEKISLQCNGRILNENKSDISCVTRMQNSSNNTGIK